jgi:hypothetical protein
VKVRLGYRVAAVVSENGTQIVVVVPKHVGGTYGVSVVVPHLGLATGARQWFRFESGIVTIEPRLGSRYGGQRVTLTGFGFAPKGSASLPEAEAYAVDFASWLNFGTANQTAPFGLDVVWATFDTLVGITHFR